MFLPALFMVIVMNGEPPKTEGCTFVGKVVLMRGDTPISPYGRVVVYLDDYRDDDKAPRAVKRLSQVDKQFDQPVMVVQRHDSIRITNDEKVKVEHDVFAKNFVNTFPPKAASLGEVTDKADFRVLGHTRLQCEKHGWMRTDVLVVKSSAYHHIKNTNGTFRIVAEKSGKYTPVAWEPNGGRKPDDKKWKCEGGVVVDLDTITLDEAPEPELSKYLGGRYEGEYSTPAGPKVDRFRPDKL